MYGHYCVNKNAQANGDHEVHKNGCRYWPLPGNDESLGLHDGCWPAIQEAEKRHPSWRVNGCIFCSPACHTS